MNAKNTLWGAAKNDHRGKQLGEAIDELDFTVLNTGRGTRLNTAGLYTSILMSPSPAPTSRWNATGGSSTMMRGKVTTFQPSSLTTNHRVRRRPTQSSDSFVGQFRLSIQGFANKEGKPGTNSVLLYSLSRSLLDECFDGQGNLIDNPGTSVTTFDMLKSAAEQVLKRIKHKHGRPKRSWVEHHSILRNSLVSHRRRRRETQKRRHCWIRRRLEDRPEWDVKLPVCIIHYFTDGQNFIRISYIQLNIFAWVSLYIWNQLECFGLLSI